MADDPSDLFAAAVADDPAGPVLTWYDDSSGERTELSGATLGNWLAKTANMLVDSAGAGPGDSVVALLPPHWQTAAVLLGAWAAGLHVDTATTAPASAAPQPVDVLFAAASRVEEARSWAAGERYVLALAPMAAPLRQVPHGWVDYVTEVRAHGDHFTPYAMGSPEAADLAARAARRAAQLGLSRGDRVLIDAAAHPDPLDWLLAPLAAGASIVLCGELDPARVTDRMAAERVNVRLS